MTCRCRPSGPPRTPRPRRRRRRGRRSRAPARARVAVAARCRRREHSRRGGPPPPPRRRRRRRPGRARCCRRCRPRAPVRLLRIDWDEGWGIKRRAVKRGLAGPGGGRPAGVDEKAIAKRHRYLTIVADLERPRVLYLADDRKQTSLDKFWPTLTPAQRDGITAVAMDMWEPYVQSTRVHLPEADTKIVFDKFHIMKPLHEGGRPRAAPACIGCSSSDGDARLTGVQVLLAAPTRGPAAGAAPGPPGLAAGRLQGGAGLGLDEHFRTFLAVSVSGAGSDLLHPLVLARDPQPARNRWRPSPS